MRSRDELTEKLAEAIYNAIISGGEDSDTLAHRVTETYVKNMSDDAFRDYVMNYIGQEYVIVQLLPDEPDQTLYWSNEDGWGDLDSATIFTEVDHQLRNLPINGQWMEL